MISSICWVENIICLARTKSVYTCLVSAHLQTCTQLEERTSRACTGVWSKFADLPVTESTCVTICGQLLAIGGRDSDSKPTTAVYMYNPSTNTWNVISHMTTARISPFAAVLPDNQLKVLVGVGMIDVFDEEGTYSDSVDIV